MAGKEYKVKPIIGYRGKLDVVVPGSKSITNRALLMAALADGETILQGALFSEDSRYFIEGLKVLGFYVEADEKKREVKVRRPDDKGLYKEKILCQTDGDSLTGILGQPAWLPRSNGQVYVGSAGTAARFLTALLAFAGGTYELDASPQMRKRPMKPLLDALTELGVQVIYQGANGFFPFTLQSEGIRGGDISIDIGISSQFLSALLMSGGMLPEGLRIHLTGERKSLPYVEMTANLMKRFGGRAIQEEKGVWHVPGWEKQDGGSRALYHGGTYEIEPDVSGACYFYAMALMLGIQVRVRGVHWNSLQGDKKFLEVLDRLGCQVKETPEGICVTGPAGGKYPGIQLNMNDFSDQTMTMAAVAAYASTPTEIRGISHIRYQESNRIKAIKTELERLGVRCEEQEDGIIIYPGVIKPSTVQTYDDHRMAMAFALIGLRTPGIVIDNPGCSAKTFEHYFELLDEIAAYVETGENSSVWLGERG